MKYQRYIILILVFSIVTTVFSPYVEAEENDVGINIGEVFVEG